MVLPINPNITVRKTDWVAVCPHCQCERILSYCQAWNIKKGKCVPECKSCAIELGKIRINPIGLAQGRTKENQEKARKNRTGVKRKIGCDYHTFKVFIESKFDTFLQGVK